MKNAKTYKREVAAAMLVVYFGIALYGIHDPEVLSIADMLTTPVFGFAALAFGADAIRQLK